MSIMSQSKRECPKCKRPCVWVRLEIGVSVQCDLEETLTIDTAGTVRQAFVPHWRTCPQAEIGQAAAIAQMLVGAQVSAPAEARTPDPAPVTNDQGQAPLIDETEVDGIDPHMTLRNGRRVIDGRLAAAGR